MALEVHVILEDRDEVSLFHKLGEAVTHLNAASFAGIGGVAVMSVGRTQQEAHDRIVAFTEDEPTV